MRKTLALLHATALSVCTVMALGVATIFVFDAEPAFASDGKCRINCTHIENHTSDADEMGAALAALGGIDFTESSDGLQVGGAIGFAGDEIGLGVAAQFSLGSSTNVRFGVASDTDGDEVVGAIGVTHAF